MKVLLYGANGWIGSQFHAYLVDNGHTVIPATSRASEPVDVAAELDTVQPTHVLACIGRTHGYIDGQLINTIDYLEYPGKLTENIRDNLYSPLLLAQLTSVRGIHFTYLGTGCIYDYEGDFTRQFSETDEPNYVGSSYSIVKGYTARLMNYYTNVLHWRIRMPITGDWNARNFIVKISRYAKVCSMPNSMTVFPVLLPIMMRQMVEGYTGTINMTNPGVITHNEILGLYRQIVDPDFTWTNFTIDEQDQVLKSKRSNNWLDTTKLEEYAPDVLPIREAVIIALRQMSAESLQHVN